MAVWYAGRLFCLCCKTFAILLPKSAENLAKIKFPQPKTAPTKGFTFP